MMLFRFLFRNCRALMFWTTFTALLSGACNAGLVGFVSTALTRSSPATRAFIWGFIALGVGKVATNVVSQIVLARFSQGAIARLRRDLIRQILGVPLRQIEEIGSARILVALTDDIFNITQALLAIPVVAVNLAVLLGGAAYLAWLSWKILAVVFALIVLGGFGYRLMVGRAFHWLTFARAEEDRLFGYFRALTEGIKELKLHRTRRSAFYQNIRDTTEVYQQHNVSAETCFITALCHYFALPYGPVGRRHDQHFFVRPGQRGAPKSE
jgi:putative ATP-binding cassette transporter